MPLYIALRAVQHSTSFNQYFSKLEFNQTSLNENSSLRSTSVGTKWCESQYMLLNMFVVISSWILRYIGYSGFVFTSDGSLD